MDNKLGWRLWSLACKLRRVCPANAHSAIIWRMRPVREMFIDSVCTADLADNGSCWCGKVRAQVTRG